MSTPAENLTTPEVEAPSAPRFDVRELLASLNRVPHFALPRGRLTKNGSHRASFGYLIPNWDRTPSNKRMTLMESSSGITGLSSSPC